MDNPIAPRPFDPEELDEFAVYRVSLMVSPNNPPHAGILLTGFDNGSYAKVCGGSFHETHPRKYHAIEVIEKIADLPDFGTFEDAEKITSDAFNNQWDYE